MKNKIINFYQKNKTILYTLLCAASIIITVYILQKVAPFGRNSLLTIDFFHQYGPMLGELYDRIKDGSNLIYSFNMSMGLPFFRNFFNYLSSPFNMIMFLFKHDNLIMSYSIIIAAKTIASATTMIIYLTKKFKTKSLYFIPLSLFYAFCAYFTAYYWNIMWLDGLVFLPLIILGIEKIIDERRPLLYIISLAVMLYANYFIAYMICLFSCLYFICYLIIKTDKFKLKEILKKCFIFGLSSLLAGGLCAIFLIPMYKALTSISATSDVFATSQYYSFTLLEFLANHFSGVGSTVLNSGISKVPNISCGILPIFLLFLFIINPKIKFKIKIVYLSLLLVLMFSFIIGPLDFIWHGFHVPNDLPFRYSFLYSFVMIIISAYSLFNIKKLKVKWVTIIFGLNLVLISLLYIFKYQNITNDMILLNFAALTIYFLLYILYTCFANYQKYIPLVFMLTAVLEITVCINNNWNILQYIDEFNSDYSDTKTALKYIKDNDSSMYRTEKTNMLTFNDPSWYNYYGQMTFSSMEYENLAILQHNLGLPGNEINSYYYKQTTPIYDLMFNLKYLIGNNLDSNRYYLYYDKNDVLINKFNYNLGLMFGLNKNIYDWNYTSENPFTIQNDFIKQATNIANVFEKLKVDSSQIVYSENNKTIVKYTTKNPKDNIYLYNNSANIDFMIIDQTLYYNNEDYTYTDFLKDKFQIFNYENYNEKYIINTSTNDETYTFYIGYNSSYQDNYYLYTINNNNFNLAYDILNNNKVNIAEFNEYLINATYVAKEEATIYTSIPYDEGWKVYVDGNPTETYALGNSLLIFDLDKGTHNIVLKYQVPGFKIGLSISCLSLLGISLLTIYLSKRKTSIF